MFNKVNITMALITAFQIFLMLSYPAATSNIIYQSHSFFQELRISPYDDNFSIKDIGNYGINLLTGFLTIKQIGVISAQTSDSVLGCCTETTDGATCQEVIEGDESCSVENFVPGTRCEEVSECKIGCCIDNNEGLCSENTPRGTCEASGGTWDDDAACNIQQCQLGCCVLGSQSQFVTEQRCGFLSGFYGLEMDYRQQVKTEVECLLLGNEQALGACLTENICEFTSKAECLSLGGEFYEGQMCSAVSECKSQASVGCVEGKDEIYWFDSCGNRENIYEGGGEEAKERSYSNGLVLSKEDSCNPDSANINSETCGNCNYLLGSTCKETGPLDIHIEDGNYVCQDLNCYNTFDGSDRVNGESWCVYDAAVGNGEDPVGSRHWRHICIDGEEIVDACSDFRQEVCVSETTDVGNGNEISSSACIANEWRSCYQYNNDPATLVQNCNQNKHCFLKEVWHPGSDVADSPVTVCLPEYPPGFQLYGDNGDIANSLCSAASQTVQVTQVKECGFLGIGSDWVYVANEVATTEAWTQSLNKWCTSLGDCGAYVNIAGEVTTGGYGVSGVAPLLSQSYLDSLAQFSIPDPNALAELSETDYGAENEDGGSFGGSFGLIGGIIGAGGVAYYLFTHGAGIANYLFGGGTVGEIAGGPGGLFGSGSATFSAFAAAAAAFAAGTIIALLFNLPEEQGLQLGVVGLVTVGTYAYIHGFETFSLTAALAWAVVVILVFAIILALLGCGDKREDPAGFQCRAWDLPSGGNDCELCNNNPLRPCTPYRCKSLGAACELINENSLEPKCIWQNPDDVTPPVMTPDQGGLTLGYEYDNTESCPGNCAHEIINTESESGCLAAYEFINVSIITDENARCNFDFKNKPYEEMSNILSGLYTENHATQISSPGVLSLEQELQNLIDNYQGTGSEFIFEDLLNQSIDGKLEIYIKCKDPNGNTNIQSLAITMCLDPEPDLTPPGIKSISPENGGSVKFGLNETQIQLRTNEPANCKYSGIDQPYETMEGSFVCLNQLNQGSIQGWLCTETISDLQDENEFFIRCEDKPSFQESEKNRNQESFIYKFFKTKNPLEIDSISPGGDFSFGFEPITLDLKVITSEGSNGGISSCSYSFQNPELGENFVEFFETNSDSHRQTFSTLISGSYTIYVQCEDPAGNIANGETHFSLNIDSTPPIVTRAFHEANELRIITNELSECYYSVNTCNFNLEGNNSISMTTALATEHRTEWNQGITYHIRCRDSFGNVPNDCSIQVSPEQL